MNVFRLPEEDTEYLSSSGRAWEIITEGPANWLIIKNFSIPPGYNETSADVALQIDSGYPDVQIDMAYFSPPLARGPNTAIPATTPMSFAGRNWQRWSRHRTPQNSWRPGIDCVQTHLDQVEEWLIRELKR
jgi:hypothetical protein